MVILTTLLLCISAVDLPAAEAETVFNGGELYLKTSDRSAEEQMLRDLGTGILFKYDDCRGSRHPDGEIYSWNTTIRRLWNEIYQPETSFTVRSGEEYLIYENYMLYYTSGDTRTELHIFPEELWVVLNQCRRPSTTLTGQISLEAWYPLLNEPFSAFVSVYDPAYPVIQELFRRGREASGE